MFDATGRPWPLLPIFGLLIGCRQHALSLLGHDGTHRTGISNRVINDRITEWFCGWPLGAVLDGGYRDWHFSHHRTLGTQGDPELAYRGSSSSYAGAITRGHIIARFIQDALGMGTSGLWGFLREILPANRRLYAGPILFYATFLAVTLHVDAFWVFALWCWSIVAGFWAVFRIRTWFEHVGLENAGREGSHRFSANALERFIFFPHNTNCHYEHHLYPQVPYSNLPALRKKILERESNQLRHIKTFRGMLDEIAQTSGSLADAI